MINLYDHEELACRKIAEELSKNIGSSRDLEGFCQEAIHRFQRIGIVVNPVTLWDEKNQCYHFQFEVVGRVEPEKYGFDFERQQWEVRHDIAGIEPDKVGLTAKFDPDLLHPDNPVKYLAKELGVTERELRSHSGHSHDDGEHEHSEDHHHEH